MPITALVSCPQLQHSLTAFTLGSAKKGNPGVDFEFESDYCINTDGALRCHHIAPYRVTDPKSLSQLILKDVLEAGDARRGLRLGSPWAVSTAVPSSLAQKYLEHSDNSKALHKPSLFPTLHIPLVRHVIKYPLDLSPKQRS